MSKTQELLEHVRESTLSNIAIRVRLRKGELLHILRKRDWLLKSLIAEQRNDLLLAIEVKQLADQAEEIIHKKMYADAVQREFEELCYLQKEYRKNRDRIVIAGKLNDD